MLNTQYEAYIIEKITEFVDNDQSNTLPAHNNMKIYGSPLVGFASAEDAYFKEFQKPGIVGTNFILPEEWLPEAKSVISYFLPFTKEIRDSNRKPGLPSEEWVSARIDGESFNNKLRAFLALLLKDLNSDAVAPTMDPRFKVVEKISNWSERHIAFVAGLGTFGLHRALITSMGTAGRLGSVITTLNLDPTPRAYTQYFEYCSYLTGGKCGACIKRCPPAAITKEGKDHKVCGDYMDKEIQPIFTPRYGCAKCNINVPCEYKIPEI